MWPPDSTLIPRTISRSEWLEIKDNRTTGGKLGNEFRGQHSGIHDAAVCHLARFETWHNAQTFADWLQRVEWQRVHLVLLTGVNLGRAIRLFGSRCCARRSDR